MRKKILLLSVVLIFTSTAFPQETPQVSLAEDGYPTGMSSPEGAACDLVRSFIDLDMEKFQKVCLPKMKSDTPVGKKYNDFIDMVIQENEKEKESGKPNPRSPKSIGKVFSARHLSLNGPSSWGYAAYNFSDVMFVDVGAFLHDGSRFLNRTMVVQAEDGTWYVLPCPTIDSLLSAGLNDESESTEDFKTKYKIKFEQDGGANALQPPSVTVPADAGTAP